MTWYPETFISWPMTTMDMRPDPASGYPGRTYRFYTGETIYKFGDGFSYSTFLHSFSSETLGRVSSSSALVTPSTAQLRCFEDPRSCADDTDDQFCRASEFTVDLIVSNTHWRAGSEVVLLYVSPPNAGAGGLALKQLVGFQRVDIAGNETATVRFLLEPCMHFIAIQSDGTRELLEGVHTVSTNGDVILEVEFKRG